MCAILRYDNIWMNRAHFPTQIPHGSTCLSKLAKTTIIATTITTDVKKLREKVNELRSRADAKAANKESESQREREQCNSLHLYACLNAECGI